MRQLPSRSEPQQAKPQPGRTGRSAIQLRSERSLPLLVAEVEVVEGRVRPTLTVAAVAGSEGRGEYRLVPHPLQEDYRADQ